MEGSRPMRLEVGEAAEHLRIELYTVQDDWRRGFIAEETLRTRIQAIRACAANLRKPVKGHTLPLILLGD